MKSFLKIKSFLTENFKWLLLAAVALVLFWDKIKSLFEHTIEDDMSNNSGSTYLGDQVNQDEKGPYIGEDGLEYFRYGKKKVRLTDTAKGQVVQYVNLLYEYLSHNTTSLMDWLLDDGTIHFYTGEIQATLNEYCKRVRNQETLIHYFAYVWIQLYSVNFLDYLKSKMDAEGYQATQTYVPMLGMFYY